MSVVYLSHFALMTKSVCGNIYMFFFLGVGGKGDDESEAKENLGLKHMH